MSSIKRVDTSAQMASLSREAAEDLPELQGMFMGRTISLSRKGDREKKDGWTSDYGRGGGDESDDAVPLEKRKGQARSALRKSETQVRKRLASTLPDFSDESELQGFGFILRRMMRDRDYSSLREEAEKFFPDVAVRHGAISAAARMMKEDTGGDPDLQQELDKYQDDLEKQFGPAVRAGYNISQRADAEAQGVPDVRQQLRDYYRSFLRISNDPKSLYRMVLEFPEAALNPKAGSPEG